jgi:hypothetical protein
MGVGARTSAARTRAYQIAAAPSPCGVRTGESRFAPAIRRAVELWCSHVPLRPRSSARPESRGAMMDRSTVDFRRDILLKLQRLPVRAIAEAMVASISHGSKVRGGC